MTYATLADLTERAGETELRQTADRDRDGFPDPAVVDAALTHADNTINGYLAARYAVPLATVPPLVNTWAVSIARYFLFRNGPPEYVAKDFNDAVSALKDASRGVIALPSITGEAAPAQQAGRVMAEHPEQAFSPSKLVGW